MESERIAHGGLRPRGRRRGRRGVRVGAVVDVLVQLPQAVDPAKRRSRSESSCLSVGDHRLPRRQRYRANKAGG